MSQLQLADAAKFDEIYRLLQSSFPDDEYRPYDAQKEVFSDPRYHVYILPGENDTIRAMITIWQFDDFAFIEHFAVSPKCRNQGLGAQRYCRFCPVRSVWRSSCRKRSWPDAALRFIRATAFS